MLTKQLMKKVILLLCLLIVPYTIAKRIRTAHSKVHEYVRAFGTKKTHFLERYEGPISEGATKTLVPIKDWPASEDDVCEILCYIKVTVNNEKQRPRISLIKSQQSVLIEYREKQDTKSGYRIDTYTARKVRCDTKH